MWKGVAVIGARIGGIAYRFEDGVNGFLVDAVDQAADRIVALLWDRARLRPDRGKRPESVRGRFLMSRLLEEWLIGSGQL